MKSLKGPPLYSIVATLLLSIIVAVVIYVIYPEGALRVSRMVQTYALIALALIYIGMLAEPLCSTFNLAFGKAYLTYKKYFAVAALYFGFLHANLVFFKLLGGFNGLGFLSSKFLGAISLGFLTLIILFVVSVIAVDKIIKVINIRGWNILYLGGFLILIHAFMLGKHFGTISDLIPQLFLAGIAFLVLLHLNRLDTYLIKKYPRLPRFGTFSTLLIGSVLFSYLYSFWPADKAFPLGIHAQHIKLAQQIQSGNVGPAFSSSLNLPGLIGDRTRRFSVDYEMPAGIDPNQDVTLSFKVSDASTGNQAVLFNKVYGKLVHMIIVDSTLTYFNHIHPTYENGTFTITTQFPQTGIYRMYIDFQPLGAIEQQFASVVRVGKGAINQPSTHQVDNVKTRNFGTYEVTLTTPKELRSADISIGKQLLSFTIRDNETKQPVTTLKPYLEAFGHLVMINSDTFEYVHVHPNDLNVPPPEANGGPTVEFMPLGIYAPIKPGIYRLFGQFNPDNKLFTSDFTIEIK